MTLRFRRATRRHMETVTNLVREYYRFDGLPFHRKHTLASLGRVFADRSLGEVWLIDEASDIVGYFVLTPCYSLEFQHEVFIDELYVREAARGRGLGRAALAFIADWAAEHDVTAIHVVSEQHNPAAREVYRRAGFGAAHRFLMTRLVNPPKHLREKKVRKTATALEPPMNTDGHR